MIKCSSLETARIVVVSALDGNNIARDIERNSGEKLLKTYLCHHDLYLLEKLNSSHKVKEVSTYFLSTFEPLNNMHREISNISKD